MRRLFILIIAMVLCLSFANIGLGQDDIRKNPACKYCGMDREKFAHSRVFLEINDFSAEETPIL